MLERLQQGTQQNTLPGHLELFAGRIMASLLFGSICVLCILSALTHTASSQQLNTVYRVSPLFMAEKRGIFELTSYDKGHK